MDFLSNLAKGGASDKSADEPEKRDKPNAAATATATAATAAADVLESASEYGKLDETQGVGKYVDQAEDYLRKYGTPQPPASGAAKTAPHETPSGGAGDYVKKAQEFLNKPSEGGEKGESESGDGGLLKTAGGFFNK